jgi:hypothetical protein
MNDMRVLGRAVAIGSADWREQLESNRSDLLRSFMQTESEKWAQLSNGEFISTLFNNARLQDKGCKIRYRSVSIRKQKLASACCVS